MSQLSSIKRHVTCTICGVLTAQIPLDDDGTVKQEPRNMTAPAPFRVGDYICFELASYDIAPNGHVTLTGRKCGVEQLTTKHRPLQQLNTTVPRPKPQMAAANHQAHRYEF